MQCAYTHFVFLCSFLFSSFSSFVQMCLFQFSHLLFTDSLTVDCCSMLTMQERFTFAIVPNNDSYHRWNDRWILTNFLLWFNFYCIYCCRQCQMECFQWLIFLFWGRAIAYIRSFAHPFAHVIEENWWKLMENDLYRMNFNAPYMVYMERRENQIKSHTHTQWMCRLTTKQWEHIASKLFPVLWFMPSGRYVFMTLINIFYHIEMYCFENVSTKL